MDNFVLFLFFWKRGVGANTKKIPAQLLQKKYKSCITAQSKKNLLQISPEKIFMQKKNFHFLFNYQLISKILSSFQVNKSQSKVQSRVQSKVQSKVQSRVQSSFSICRGQSVHKREKTYSHASTYKARTLLLSPKNNFSASRLHFFGGFSLIIIFFSDF